MFGSRWRLAGLVAALIAAALLLHANRAGPRIELALGAGERPSSALAPSVDSARSLPLEAPPPVATGVEGTSRAALAEAREPRVGARLTLRAMHRGAPVAGARLWLTAQGLEDGTTDERGEVGFDVPAGRASFGFEDVGGAHSDGQFVVLGGPPAASGHVTVQDGVDQVIVLALESAASVGGVVLDVDGVPLPDFQFRFVRAEGDAWGRPRSVLTDSAGRFMLERVPPGWTLLGPDPARRDVFPFERFELARGEHRDVELRLLPRRRVLVELDVVGEVQRVPWPLPIAVRIERVESLAGLVGTLMPPYELAPPHRRTEELSPGAHVVRAWSRPWSTGTFSIAPEWERCIEFTVATDVDALRVAVPVPELGPLAVVHCSLTAPEGTTRLSVGWTDRGGQPNELGLPFDKDLRCKIVIDLDEVPDRTVMIHARAGSVRRTLASMALQPGESSVTLTPGD